MYYTWCLSVCVCDTIILRLGVKLLLLWPSWCMQSGIIVIFIFKLVPTIAMFRYVGYSYIHCAWYAFPFEALEVFTFFSLQVSFFDGKWCCCYVSICVKVGAAKFIAEKAPPGLLATLTGLEGGAHNGLGKGFGGLLGGFTIEYTKSTHKASFNFL